MTYDTTPEPPHPLQKLHSLQNLQNLQNLQRFPRIGRQSYILRHARSHVSLRKSQVGLGETQRVLGGAAAELARTRRDGVDAGDDRHAGAARLGGELSAVARLRAVVARRGAGDAAGRVVGAAIASG